jgi:hypothetical protein
VKLNAALFNTRPTRIDSVANPGLRGDRPAYNRLSYDMTLLYSEGASENLVSFLLIQQCLALMEDEVNYCKQFNAVHISHQFYFRMHFNIILTSIPRSPKRSNTLQVYTCIATEFPPCVLHLQITSFINTLKRSGNYVFQLS